MKILANLLIAWLKDEALKETDEALKLNFID